MLVQVTVQSISPAKNYQDFHLCQQNTYHLRRIVHDLKNHDSYPSVREFPPLQIQYPIFPFGKNLIVRSFRYTLMDATLSIFSFVFESSHLSFVSPGLCKLYVGILNLLFWNILLTVPGTVILLHTSSA